MSYFVKVCSRCKAPNNAWLVYCGKCGADLPQTKIETDIPPPAPPAYAMPQTCEAGPPSTDAASSSKQFASPIECKIVDVEIKFASMVALLVKLAIAAVPAALIVAVFWIVAVAVITAIRQG